MMPCVCVASRACLCASVRLVAAGSGSPRNGPTTFAHGNSFCGAHMTHSLPCVDAGSASPGGGGSVVTRRPTRASPALIVHLPPNVLLYIVGVARGRTPYGTAVPCVGWVQGLKGLQAPVQGPCFRARNTGFGAQSANPTAPSCQAAMDAQQQQEQQQQQAPHGEAGTGGSPPPRQDRSGVALTPLQRYGPVP